MADCTLLEEGVRGRHFSPELPLLKFSCVDLAEKPEPEPEPERNNFMVLMWMQDL